MNKLEEEFQELVIYLESKMAEGEQIQRVLKETKVENLPENLKRAMNFYNSLSGDSKNFLFTVAKNPNTKKVFFKSKKKTPLRIFSTLNYQPK